MGLITGRTLGVRLMRALGIEDPSVTQLTLRCVPDDIARCEYTRMVPGAPGSSVSVDTGVSEEQGDALVREITRLNTPVAWREFTRQQWVPEAGALEGEGPAERLARAVLAGDWESALVLADLVQESWADEQRRKEGGA